MKPTIQDNPLVHRPCSSLHTSQATKCAQLTDTQWSGASLAANIQPIWGGRSVGASWLRNLTRLLSMAGPGSGTSEKLVTSKVRISCCVRSLDAAHLVRSPCKLEMEISIIFWMSSHWCSAAIAAPPPPLSLSGWSSLSTIFPPFPDTLSIPQHWARLEGLESNC